jgi:trigger factor
MPSALTTKVSELPESRVRVEVEIPAAELERSVERQARVLAGKLKLPGFRRGKVPTPLVIQRVGREVVLEDAVREHLGEWYVDALDASGIAPVGDPDLSLGELPPAGQDLQFSFEIGVVPQAALGEYKGLEVGRAEPEVSDEQIQAELDQLRDRLARLETVARPAQEGDFVVLDYEGTLRAEDGTLAPFPGGEGRDQLIELGAGNLIEGFESGLLGASAGEQRTLELTFPDDYGRSELAGRPATFAVTVKEVKHKQLPDVDEDLAIDTGFDSVEELRGDIERRLREAQEQSIAERYREDALDAAVAHATVEVPAAHVAARAREMWERILHTLSHRGLSREAYLQISGRSEQESLAELEPDAERALRREAVLKAVVHAERIEPSEQELLDAVAPTAEREDTDPQKLLEQLRANGRLEDLRDDLAARRAMELIAESAKPIALERARAREQLWTPEKEREERAREDDAGAVAGTGGTQPQEAGGLWTPGR